MLRHRWRSLSLFVVTAFAAALVLPVEVADAVDAADPAAADEVSCATSRR